MSVAPRDICQLTHVPSDLICLDAEGEHLTSSLGELHTVEGGAIGKLSYLPEHLTCTLSVADQRLKCDARLLCLHTYFRHRRKSPTNKGIGIGEEGQARYTIEL